MTGRHALRTDHHRRELTDGAEPYQQAWATPMKALLCEMLAAPDDAGAPGAVPLADASHATFVAGYQALLARGLAANPPPIRSPGHRGRLKPSPARDLLERRWLGQDQVLALRDDLTLPFDHHKAERDQRLLKTQQKGSGCFRGDRGADAFARIRGYLATLRKQGVALLDALRTLFTDSPLSPALG